MFNILPIIEDDGVLLHKNGHNKWAFIRVIVVEAREVYDVTYMVLFKAFEEYQRSDHIQKEEN